MFNKVTITGDPEGTLADTDRTIITYPSPGCCTAPYPRCPQLVGFIAQIPKHCFHSWDSKLTPYILHQGCLSGLSNIGDIVIHENYVWSYYRRLTYIWRSAAPQFAPIEGLLSNFRVGRRHCWVKNGRISVIQTYEYLNTSCSLALEYVFSFYFV